MSVSLINRSHFFAPQPEAKKAPALQLKHNASTRALFPGLNAELEKISQLLKQLENSAQQKNARELMLGIQRSKQAASKVGFFSAPKPPAPKGNVLDFLAPKPR